MGKYYEKKESCGGKVSKQTERWKEGVKAANRNGGTAMEETDPVTQHQRNQQVKTSNT